MVNSQHASHLALGLKNKAAFLHQSNNPRPMMKAIFGMSVPLQIIDQSFRDRWLRIPKKRSNQKQRISIHRITWTSSLIQTPRRCSTPGRVVERSRSTELVGLDCGIIRSTTGIPPGTASCSAKRSRSGSTARSHAPRIWMQERVLPRMAEALGTRTVPHSPPSVVPIDGWPNPAAMFLQIEQIHADQRTSGWIVLVQKTRRSLGYTRTTGSISRATHGGAKRRGC